MTKKVILSLLVAFCLLQSVRVFADESAVQMQQSGNVSVEELNQLSDEELAEITDEDPEVFRFIHSQKEAEKNQGKSSISTLSSGNSIFDNKTYTHNSRFKDYKITQGIDVSKWDGDINWTKVKAAGVDFAIVRVGYRSYGSGGLYSDSYYKTNIQGALDAGLNVGVYIYSQAITQAEAVAEANYVLSRISGYKINYPVVLDYEYAGSEGRLYNARLSKTAKTNICKAFCDTVEAAGYDAMVYANKSMLNDDLYASQLSDKYKIWLANYTTKTTYSGEYICWQFSETGRVSGISTNVDCNFWYEKSNESQLPVSNSAAAETVSLAEKDITLLKGNKKTLTVTVTPKDTNEKVQWTSENSSVAKVSSTGEVTAVGRGSTTITAKIKNGKTAKCTVLVQEDLSSGSISMGISSYVYTGKAIKPSVTVKLAARTLTKDTDYIVKYSNNKNIGTATITVGGINTYTGTLKKTFKIYDRIPLSKCSFSSLSNATYTGKAITPSVKVKNGTSTLKKGTDYTVKYSSNKNPGKAAVTINGIGNYTGTKRLTFQIVPAKVANLKASTVTKSSVTLTWSQSAGVTGYEIYRADRYGKSPTLIKTVSSKQTSYKNTGLKAGYEYTYTVKAYKDKLYSVAATVTAHTTAASVKIVTKGTVNLRKGAGDAYSILTKVGKGTVLNTKWQVLSKAGNTWYKVSYKKGSTTYTGYISASTSTKTLKASVSASSLALRKGAGTSYQNITYMKKGEKLSIQSSAYNRATGVTWVKVKMTKGSKTYTGYCSGQYISL